jgi:hypothetical protein
MSVNEQMQHRSRPRFAPEGSSLNQFYEGGFMQVPQDTAEARWML